MPTVFGFDVRTPLPLQFLRESGGGDPLEILVNDESEPAAESVFIAEWPLHGVAYEAKAQLYSIRDGFEYRTSDAGRFVVDVGKQRILIPPTGGPLLREQRLLGMPMLLSFAHRGDLSLHASAAEVGGGAIILAAPSRFGKTTLALAFHTRGHRLLSEDLCCCRPGGWTLLPGPSLVRIRPDVFVGTPPAGTEVLAVQPDRVFLRTVPSGSGEALPIRGIFFLRQGDVVRVTPSDPHDAVKDLWHLGYRMPTTADRERSFRDLVKLSTVVPVYDIWRPMRLDTLDEVVERVVECVAQ